MEDVSGLFQCRNLRGPIDAARGGMSNKKPKGDELASKSDCMVFPIKKLLLVAALAAGWVYAAHAAVPTPLTTVRAVGDLTNEEARHGLPATVEATVSYFRAYERTLFVEDGGAAIYVKATTDLPLAPGDRVQIRGTTSAGFRPSLSSSDIVLLGHGPAPRAVASTFDEMIAGKRDCMMVSVRGVARTADLVSRTDVRGGSRPNQLSARVQILIDGGYVEAMIDTSDERAMNALLDAEVEVTGVAAGSFDGKYHQMGIQIYVSSLGNVKVLRRAATSPWSIPAIPMGGIISTLHESDLSGRVRVHGTITYYQYGSAAVLEDGSESLWIDTQTRNNLRVGDVADAIGFPDPSTGQLSLNHAEIRDRNVQAPIEPRPVDWAELASSRRVFDLVSIEGEVVTTVQEAAQDEYVLRSDGHLFSAIIRRGPEMNQVQARVQPLKDMEAGTIIRVTGICISEDSNPFSTNVPFNILLRSADDIVVVAKPGWLSVRHLTELVVVLLFVVLVVVIRVWLVELRVRRQVGALAYMERRRGKILEDINNSRPLAEILESITELVSAGLNGTLCWCQIVNGAKLGNYPPESTGSAMRIVEQPIAGRSGPALGSIFAALDAHTKPRAMETEALTMAAGLATLAIETSRLYSDLVHRSEYDLLTDIQNRFSIEKQLDAAIKAARLSAGVFGLLYIDLNDFKQVNDGFGHRVGDLYLQEVATRMKKQLRPGDMLARLGGDEFAALVPNVHSRAAVEEIALRLEISFELPFSGDGYEVHGSASIGLALYPEDGITKDSLLSAADGAMYVAKQTRHRRSETPAGTGGRELMPKDRKS
jgi:diguanylate cyclase (GGDEF)-like protein